MKVSYNMKDTIQSDLFDAGVIMLKNIGENFLKIYLTKQSIKLNSLGSNKSNTVRGEKHNVCVVINISTKTFETVGKTGGRRRRQIFFNKFLYCILY